MDYIALVNLTTSRGLLRKGASARGLPLAERESLAARGLLRAAPQPIAPSVPAPEPAAPAAKAKKPKRNGMLDFDAEDAIV